MFARGSIDKACENILNDVYKGISNQEVGLQEDNYNPL